MRFFSFGAVLALLGLMFAGCMITVENGGGSPDVDYSDRGRDAATLAEIDAASQLTFDSDQKRVYIGIASRPHLSGRAQGYLVKKAMQSLTFDESKRDVLLAVVNNPYFVAEGKQAVLANLNLLTFDSSKRKVLEAINLREPVPTQRELQRQLEHIHPLQEPQEQGAIEMETTVEMEASYLQEL